jgi:hypothetical protein
MRKPRPENNPNQREQIAMLMLLDWRCIPTEIISSMRAA